MKASDLIRVELFYPRNEKSADTIEVGLCDIRSADNIRIQYDFERDGWVIYQEISVEHGDFSTSKDPEEWVEVSFVQAWANQKECDCCEHESE